MATNAQVSGLTQGADASRSPLAILISGGLDSAILLAEAARARSAVYPLYVRCGLCWETVELQHLRRFLDALPVALAREQPKGGSLLHALQVLELPVADLYGGHWSITGHGVPDARTPDEAVFLPGRNVLLLAKAMLWCQLNGVHELALGLLGSNPFPDATAEFIAAYQDVVNRGMGGSVQVSRPFAGQPKSKVMALGRNLPLELTFSCIQPTPAGLHCGKCNKCAERRKAFGDAGITDVTEYSSFGIRH